VRLIGFLILAVVLAIALWLVVINPRLSGERSAVVVAPDAAPATANTVVQNQMIDEAAQQAAAASKAKAEKARAEALAAQRAVEAAQADAIVQNMSPAENRLDEDYATQVGDTRPAPSDTSNATAPPDRSGP
jgi:membrane protein involved in colicin uptake